MYWCINKCILFISIRNKNSYSDSSKENTVIWNKHFSLTYFFPLYFSSLLDSLVNFLLIFKQFDVLSVFLGSQSWQSSCQQMKDGLHLIFFPPTKYCLFVVFCDLTNSTEATPFDSVAHQKQITIFITAFEFTVLSDSCGNCSDLSNSSKPFVIMAHYVSFSAEIIANT